MSGFGSKIETVTKLAGAIAVLGFMSSRAHMNFIGIPSMLVSDVPTYLTETYLLVATISLRLLVIAACLAMVVLPLALLWWLLRRTTLRKSISHLERSVSAWCVASPLGVFVVVLILLSGVLTLMSSLKAPWDIAVGTLTNPGIANTDQLLFDLTIGSILLTTLWFRRALRLASANLQSAAPVAQWVIYGLILFASALVPVLHGHGVRPAMYPEATLEAKDGTRVCGLLVSSTDKDYVIWVPQRISEAVVGTMEIFPRDGTHHLKSGRLRDLTLLIAQLSDREHKDPVICNL